MESRKSFLRFYISRWRWATHFYYFIKALKGTKVKRYVWPGTLGGIALICFRFHFQQTQRIHTQGCQKTINFERNSKILIARSTIQPELSKIKNNLPFYGILMHFSMVFDFTQFWLDGWPGNEYFLISHKISGLLTPLSPLGVHP